MPLVRDVCRHVRSKNAGPFWVTFDFFFSDEDTFHRYADSIQLQPEAISELFNVDPATIKRFLVPNLLVRKISFPRAGSQGGMVDRDVHQGQQYVRLLDIAL